MVASKIDGGDAQNLSRGFEAFNIIDPYPLTPMIPLPKEQVSEHGGLENCERYTLILGGDLIVKAPNNYGSGNFCTNEEVCIKNWLISIRGNEILMKDGEGVKRKGRGNCW